jgi:uncharacterized iron-regulated membrane protein
LFQIHQFTGLIVGMYAFAISLSGSVMLYRNILSERLSTTPDTVTVKGQPLTQQALKKAALLAYPDYSVNYIWQGTLPNQVVEIWMRRGDKQKQRLFDPYTGADVGPSVSIGIKVLAWVADLHRNLLAGRTGRTLNGVGAGLLVVLCFTGTLVWWPGIHRVRPSLVVNWRTNWKRLSWDLHRAVGFGTVLFTLMWSVTGMLLAFQRSFERLLVYLTPTNQPIQPGSSIPIGERILFWPAYLHFANDFGLPLEVLWGILGLAPALLFVTGSALWWNRVLAPAMKRAGTEALPDGAQQLRAELNTSRT